MGKRLLHHAHGGVHDQPPRRDDGLGLLAAQHGLGDFRGVGQVADAGLDYLHAGNLEPLLDFLGERLSDGVGAAAQRELVFLGVVGVAAGQGADGRFHLDLHELFVVVHVEDRAGGIHHLPDHHGADLDRVAVLVVDLEDLGVEVTHPQAHLAAAGQGVGPPKAVFRDAADVAPEEDQHLGLIGLDREEAGRQQQEQEAGNQAPGQRAPARLACGRGEKEPGFPGAKERQRQNDHQHGKAAYLEGLSFLNLSHNTSWYHNDITLITAAARTGLIGTPCLGNEAIYRVPVGSSPQPRRCREWQTLDARKKGLVLGRRLGRRRGGLPLKGQDAGALPARR